MHFVIFVIVIAMVKVTSVKPNLQPKGTATVSMNRCDCREAKDIVKLVKNIKSADTQVDNNACAKLLIIAEQVEFLQQQAPKILDQTQATQELHHAACNFK